MPASPRTPRSSAAVAGAASRRRAPIAYLSGPTGKTIAVGLAFCLALAAALAPSARRAPSVLGAGIAYADTCDSCAAQRPPTPDHEPGGPSPR